MSALKDAIVTLNEYQVAASRTAIYPGQGGDQGVAYCILGVAGEAGEVAQLLKKQMRDATDPATFEENLVKELGDLLWYIAGVATELDISLSEIATANIAKLDARMDAGTLRGSGDDR